MSNTGADDQTAVVEPAPSLLEQEIPLQPDVLRRAAASFADPISNLLDALAGRDVDDWVVTGCGDSLFAGVCAEVWFARIAGRRLRAVQAMQLSRETYEALTPRSVVLAVSHSGTTARVLEAARAARARGAFVVAVTANPASELATSADLWIDNSVRHERSNCRTASFQAVSLLMRMLAEALAARAGRPVRPFDPGLIVPYIMESREQVGQVSDADLAGDQWIFTGSGLGLAAAEYGMAKAYEAATLPAHSVELEQFIHCEIFTVRPGTNVVIICPAGRALSRAVELAEGLAKLGAVTIAITNAPSLADAATYSLRLPDGVDEDDLPFVGVLPLQWLALRLALQRGENPDLVANKWVNRPLIDNSAQWGPERYHVDPTLTSAEASR
ncbi:SIS domain-containing protein [Dactylosporangium sp. NPDC048998]|uniref:SIS domain-containing protein n=1 Tax=Dactylosporangium sp. NPDC048998 TaxID=3363976 RepID=UPI00371A9602